MQPTDRTWPRSTAHELDAFVQRFERAALLPEEWTHAAHLVVGTWYVYEYGAGEALVRLRAGITRLNEAHSTPNTETRGYHETITRAYVQLIAAFVVSQRSKGALACVCDVLEGPIGLRDVLFTYYSRSRLNSVVARKGWVEPDLRPFPK